MLTISNGKAPIRKQSNFPNRDLGWGGEDNSVVFETDSAQQAQELFLSLRHISHEFRASRLSSHTKISNIKKYKVSLFTELITGGGRANVLISNDQLTSAHLALSPTYSHTELVRFFYLCPERWTVGVFNQILGSCGVLSRCAEVVP